MTRPASWRISAPRWCTRRPCRRQSSAACRSSSATLSSPITPGTRISAQSTARGPIKGLTLSPGLAILNLEGTGLIGVPGTAERVFASLRNARVSVVMISQGSSEHSICCVVREEESARAQEALLLSFTHELAVGQVQRVQLTTGVSVLAAVGDGMAGQPGVAARLFESLGRAQVNILAIAQGSSERNISVAVDSLHATRAARRARRLLVVAADVSPSA